MMIATRSLVLSALVLVLVLLLLVAVGRPNTLLDAGNGVTGVESEASMAGS